jgi:hypothetical protein
MREAPQWNPAHWSDEKVQRYTKHTLKWAGFQLAEMIGGYESALVLAEIRSYLAGELSKVRLKQAGVPTIGDSDLDRRLPVRPDPQ